MIFTKVLKNTIQTKNAKILIVFDDMIAGMFSNKNSNPIIAQLFIRGRKSYNRIFLYQKNLILIKF